MENELPLYDDMFITEYLIYFKNPQYRFNTFFNCNLSLKYDIQDYVKSGFLLKYPDTVICYKCNLETKISDNIDPCVIHKKYKSLCTYTSKNEIHRDDPTSLSHELSLILLIICIVLVICIIVAALHVSNNC